MNLNKKDDAALAKKRDQFIDEVIEILKRQGTVFKSPKSAFIELFEQNMEEPDIKSVDQNQSESAKVLTAVNKKRETLK